MIIVLIAITACYVERKRRNKKTWIFLISSEALGKPTNPDKFHPRYARGCVLNLGLNCELPRFQNFRLNAIALY